VDEALDFVTTRCLKQSVRAKHVCLCVRQRVAEGGIHVALSGEVHDGVNLMELHQVRHQVEVTDVTMAVRVVSVRRYFGNILER